jgi:BirA family biotin operon repressor/biotin-[acetyl-CoA-carboxylase] ligase
MNNDYVSSMRAQDGSIVKLECHDALGSTKKLARTYARMGYPDRYVVFAERLLETGEGGDVTDSNQKGIFMSCILRPSIFPSQAALLRALCAAGTASALADHTESEIGIGWISNIYCDGKFIGDVSIEGKLDNFTSYEYIIVSFRISLNEHDFPPRITDLIRQVFESNNASVPLIIAKNILNKTLALYSNMKNQQKYMDIYRQRFILEGVKVKYSFGEKKYNGRIKGINSDDCTLIIEAKDKSEIKINSTAQVVIPKYIIGKKKKQKSGQ